MSAAHMPGDLPADPLAGSGLPPTDLFDSGGLPTGELGDALIEGVLRRLEADVAADGWDQPAQLFAISTPAAALAQLAEHGVHDAGRLAALLDPDADPDALATLWGIGKLADVPGHPPLTMWGLTAPDDTAALVLVTEGWTYPPDGPGDHTGPPESHPDRREVRFAQAITRDGRGYALQRARGEQPVFFTPDHGRLAGLLPDVLRRALGAPADPSAFRPAHLLGRRVLIAAAETAAAADPSVDAATLGAAGSRVTDLRRELGALDADERAEAVGQLLLSLSVRLVAMLTTGVAGEEALPEELRGLAGTAESPESPVAGVGAVLDAIRAATAPITWVELSRSGLAAALPEQLREDAAWAGEDLAGTLADHRLGPDAAESLAVIAAHAGAETAGPLAALLRELGWLEPDTLASGLEPTPDAGGPRGGPTGR